MNKTTVALTPDEYKEIIGAMRNGFTGCRPNNRVATVLVLEANLGLRISDIMDLKLNSVIKDGDRRRLDIIEHKSGKSRTFTVPMEIYIYMQDYCLQNDIRPNERMFPITQRAVQKHLKAVCDYLGFCRVSTHSFRKFFATQIYLNNDFNIILVQKLLQHSTAAVTQKYIGIEPKALEEALKNHIKLI